MSCSFWRGERALEDPSYEKIRLVYEANGAHCEKLPLGADGIESAALDACTARVLHVTPFHSYPSGVTATAAKRREYALGARAGCVYNRGRLRRGILGAAEAGGDGVLPRAGESDIHEHLHKTIAPAMRMGYMVLPGGLLARFEEQLGFYSCTVPVFEQYVLAEFIRSGELERYINRRRRACAHASRERKETAFSSGGAIIARGGRSLFTIPFKKINRDLIETEQKRRYHSHSKQVTRI